MQSINKLIFCLCFGFYFTKFLLTYVECVIFKYVKYFVLLHAKKLNMFIRYIMANRYYKLISKIRVIEWRQA